MKMVGVVRKSGGLRTLKKLNDNLFKLRNLEAGGGLDIVPSARGVYIYMYRLGATYAVLLNKEEYKALYEEVKNDYECYSTLDP